MVLFDFPSDTENGINYSSGFGISTGQTYWDSNPVWCVLLDCLLNHDINGGGGGGKKKKGGRKLSERDRVMRQQCRECYMADRAVWGVHVGSHPVMIRYTPLSNLLSCFMFSLSFTNFLSSSNFSPSLILHHSYSLFTTTPSLTSTPHLVPSPRSLLSFITTILTPPHSSPPLLLQC